MQYLTVPLLTSGAKDMFFKCVIVFMACDVRMNLFTIITYYIGLYICRRIS